MCQESIKQRTLGIVPSYQILYKITMREPQTYVHVGLA